ncbi:TetR/AcrR family transcriptional regulator [Pseudomaricurvus alkylphenolicus]|jgi:AcrR family transcriptional regulator|uniref:TetR/AcrR family transcriptional regulator n=1 Tax=Pseudomaricurvus alkylphenolicus TaxID=1306991 RepID=UPI001423BB3F|nr:TetR/AcrR family transcriptional regulator [Pseudomaricurvus alkylphenolicus]NIB38098.1 TetR/AcrR family transcriptional regulator [Pseudomaricurvus alkylphenolicus]
MNASTTQERKQPQQERAQKRRQQILATSIEIMKSEGLDRLNTAYISEKLGISVGSIYRYFPNKQSILYSMVAEWLDQNRQALEEIEKWPVEEMSVHDFVHDFFQRIAPIYRSHGALTLLLRILVEVPELRELGDRHDEFVIKLQMRILNRLGVGKSRAERRRISELWLNQGHFGLALMIEQGPRMANRTQQDLVSMLVGLMERHYIDN